LRALAVLAVIANHLNQAVARDCFLGVDFFFVISGYVVTSSLLAQQVTSPLSFLRS
jgi:peptidoglycan/LPS O-acetylase OafA/YrhL